MGKPGVLLYYDRIEPLANSLNDEDFGILCKAVIEYSHYKQLPDFQSNKILRLAWGIMQPALDLDDVKYDKSVYDRKVAGIKSYFRNYYAKKHGIDPSDEEALEKYIRQRLLTSVDECLPNQKQNHTIINPSPTSTTTATSNITTATSTVPDLPEDPVARKEEVMRSFAEHIERSIPLGQISATQGS